MPTLDTPLGSGWRDSTLHSSVGLAATVPPLIASISSSDVAVKSTFTYGLVTAPSPTITIDKNRDKSKG